MFGTMLKELESSSGRITAITLLRRALGAGEEHYDIVADGLSDMGYFTLPGRPAVSAERCAFHARFVGGKDVAVDIGNAMYEHILHQEYLDVKVLNLNGCVQSYFGPQAVACPGRCQRAADEVAGGLQAYMIEALGAEPVFLQLAGLPVHGNRCY